MRSKSLEYSKKTKTKISTSRKKTCNSFIQQHDDGFSSSAMLQALSEVVTLHRSSCPRCSIKKGVFKNLAKLIENTCIGVYFLIKLQASGMQLYQNFPVRILEFLRTPFFTEHLQAITALTTSSNLDPQVINGGGNYRKLVFIKVLCRRS